MAQDIIAGSDALRDLNRPSLARGEELIGRPMAGLRVPGYEAFLVDLVEFQGCFVYGRTLPIAVGEVIDDGAVVGVWPCIPLELHASACGYFDGGLAWGGSFVADDVGIGVCFWEHEAVILVFWDRPAGYDGGRVLACEAG